MAKGRIGNTVVGFVVEFARIIILSLAIILPVRYFLVQPFYVKGASMEPNFYDHEYLIINEIGYRFHEPKRGEIVVFRYPKNPSQFFIKRVIGLPGETVVMTQGTVRVLTQKQPNGVLLTESYLGKDMTSYGEVRQRLKSDEYFVLGDNRPQSFDSEEFGPVNKKFIIGRVWVRGWPFGSFMIFHTPLYPELD